MKNVLKSHFTRHEAMSNDDTRFLLVTIDVLHTGLNLNGSVFTKEVVDKCADSIKNTPILGYVKVGDEYSSTDFAGHEYIEIETKEGYTEKYLGSAYGVIPESCNPRWITKLGSDGEEREYFRVDGVLWTKFDEATNIFNRDIEKAQSMELEVSSMEFTEVDETGVPTFSNFKFEGCCILGEGVLPAMVDANVVANFSLSDFNRKMKEEFSNMFKAYTDLVDEKNEQGGIGELNKTKNTEEAIVGKEAKTENVKSDFAQTMMEQFEDMSRIVTAHEEIHGAWETTPRYSLVDIQESEVICLDRKNNYIFMGFPYTFEGDKPVINFELGKRKKTQYGDYVNGEIEVFDFAKEVEKVENNANEKINALETEKTTLMAEVETLTAIKAEYEEMKPKFEAYVEAENQRRIEEARADKEAVFTQYESILADNTDFITLRQSMDEYELSDIEKECALIYARKTLAVNFSKRNETEDTVIGVEPSMSVENGYVIDPKYGKMKTKRK